MSQSPFYKDRFTAHIERLRDEICQSLEKADGKTRFVSDFWERPGGGGGESRVISNGNIFEKGGVNISVVHGLLPNLAAQQLKVQGEKFFACGLSLVIHPFNPFVPTVHANWRYLEVYATDGSIVDAWFGGGTDLTPYYLFEEDAIHFHAVQKSCCDRFDVTLYPTLKIQCDDYFCNHHRGGERRGIGGIFFDHCRAAQNHSLDFWQAFAEANGNSFIESYLPIVKRRKDMPFSAQHKHWQEIRRGRYVEFNLLHDRGTLFGIRTNGRTESILMSLPPTVRFEYNDQPAKESEEARLVEVLMHPKDWLQLNPASV
jgi:coproporphyrinogen III oxidase